VQCHNFLVTAGLNGLVDGASVYVALAKHSGGDGGRLLDLGRSAVDSKVQKQAIESGIATLAKNPGDALSAIGTSPAYLRVGLERILAGEWVAREGEQALNKIVANSQSTASLFNEALQKYADQSPAKALNYVSSLDTKELTQKWGVMTKRSYYATLLPRAEPEDAVLFLKTLPQSMFRDFQTAAHIGRLIEEKPEHLDTLLAEASAEPSLINAFSQAALRTSVKQPLLGAKLLNAIPGERQREQLSRRIAKQFAEKDLARAREWVGAIENPLTRSLAEKELMKRAPKRQ
jgi:hypothetical protein